MFRTGLLALILFPASLAADPAKQPQVIDHIALGATASPSASGGLFDQMASDGNAVTGTLGSFSFTSAMNDNQDSALQDLSGGQSGSAVVLPMGQTSSFGNN